MDALPPHTDTFDLSRIPFAQAERVAPKRHPAFAHKHPRRRLYQEPTLLPISWKRPPIAPAPLRRCLSERLASLG